MTMLDWQRYPWTIYLVNNVENIVDFLGLKVFNSKVLSCSWNAQTTFVVKITCFQKYKRAWIFQGYRCESGIAILAWRVTQNYSPLKGSRVSIRKTFAQFLRNETQNFSFFTYHFCAKKQQFAQSFAKVISRKIALFRFCETQVLRNSAIS